MATDRSFRASQAHIWHSIDNLGNGAFGSVFKGYHKKSGFPVAVKTFNSKFMLSPQHLQQHARELEILKDLDHPNIIKLICVESEVKAGHPTPQATHMASHPDMVLVMELATEGSLYSIIEQPINNCGLCDAAFLLVLSHLTAGLKYLRDKNVVHRDVKPSNILKTITDEGEVLYKLCDFGAARILAENEPFQSIVGTEEYLHPAIYDRALLGGLQSQFSATCDLWSIGVTLYHVATGQLPFRPYGGARGNKTTMFHMVTQKPSGAISGSQQNRNGEIRWSHDLPRNCRLSSGLRILVAKLLQKLLEQNKSQQWSFEKFFQEVSLISQSIPVSFFCVRSARLQSAYILPGKLTLNALLDAVCSQLPETRKEDLCLLWNGKTVSDYDETELIREVKQQNSKINPLIVVQRNGPTMLLPTPKLPDEFRAVQVTDQLQLDADVETGKRGCTMAHWVIREVGALGSAKKLLHLALSDTVRVLRERMTRAESGLSAVKKTWSCVLDQLEPLRLCCEMSEEVQKNVSRKGESAKQISTAVSQVESELLSVKSSLISLRTESTLSSIPLSSGNETASNNINSVMHISECLEEIFMQFKKDRSMRIEVSNVNEVNWHNLKKKQMMTLLQKVEKSLSGDDFQALLTVHNAVQSELEGLMDTSDRLRKIEVQLEGSEGVIGMIDAFQETVSQVTKSHIEKDHSQSDISKKGALLSGSGEPNSFMAKSSESEITNTLLKVVQDTQDLRSMTQTNAELLQQYRNLIGEKQQ